MRLILTGSFQRDVLALAEDEQRAAVFEALLSLPRAMRDAHRHAGIGLRKLHPSGIWEARVGLSLRIVLAREDADLVLVRAGTHDEIRRYLRSL